MSQPMAMKFKSQFHKPCELSDSRVNTSQLNHVTLTVMGTGKVSTAK